MPTIRKASITCLPLLAALLLPACSDVTRPTPVQISPAIDVFTGTLEPGGTVTFPFSLSSSSSVKLTLAGVTLNNPPRSISPTLRLGIANWDGSNCLPDANRQTDTEPLFVGRVQAYLSVGTYCAQVIDTGGLTERVDVTVRLVLPAVLTFDGEAGSRTFGSTITPGGTASTTVVASRAGQVTVTLDSVSENAEMALALGIPGNNGGCRYGQVVRTTAGPGPHISAPVDPGRYCAAIIDVGNLTGQGTFSQTITHP